MKVNWGIFYTLILSTTVGCSFESEPSLPEITIASKSAISNADEKQKSIIPLELSPIKEVRSQTIENSCTESLDGLFFPLAAKRQQFSILAEKDEVVLGEKGTAVAFPSNSLEHSDGKIVTGQINIQLTEFQKPSECAAQNISTRNTEGELLETVGMVQIIATQNGDTLKLKSDEEIAIAFPLKPAKKKYFIWNSRTTEQGEIEWEVQNTQQPKTKEQENAVPVHMVQLIGNRKREFINWRSCGGSSWNTYFNARFKFQDGDGEELLDDKNFLAYYFRVNKNGTVSNVYAEKEGYPKNIYDLSVKYQSTFQEFFRNYPKMNLCEQPDFKKQEFRFLVKPGGKINASELVNLSEKDGGYTAAELLDLYEKTGGSNYLDAYIKKLGENGVGRIPQTRKKRSNKILNSFLNATGSVGRVILNSVSLGLLNGDCLYFQAKDKFVKGAEIKTILTGMGAAVYMVFKNVKSFVQGTMSNNREFTFGTRIPKGEPVAIIAVVEKSGARFMEKIETLTDDQILTFNPVEKFDISIFQSWLDSP